MNAVDRFSFIVTLHRDHFAFASPRTAAPGEQTDSAIKVVAGTIIETLDADGHSVVVRHISGNGFVTSRKQLSGFFGIAIGFHAEMSPVLRTRPDVVDRWR